MADYSHHLTDEMMLAAVETLNRRSCPTPNGAAYKGSGRGPPAPRPPEGNLLPRKCLAATTETIDHPDLPSEIR
jgi:hypothetical protein